MGWVRNAYNLMAIQPLYGGTPSGTGTYGAGSLGLVTTGGTLRTNTSSGYHSRGVARIVGGTGNVWGIVVGTGTNAESVEDYALQTLIAHGDGAGELYYQAQDAYDSGNTVYTSSTKTWANQIGPRLFNNNSGGAIGVNEVGLYAQDMTVGTTIVAGPYLIVRTKLAAQVDVPDGGQLSAEYEIEVVMPV